MPIDSDAGPYRLLSPLTPQVNPHHRNNHDSQKNLQNNNNNDNDNLNQLDLIIENVQAGQTSGDYKCLASNSEGSIEAHSQVVLAVPAVITTLPRNQTRLEGERVEFPCQAKALPANITYKWLFNDKPISSLKWFDSRHTQKRDGTLVIHSLHREDQGEYKCQATNGLYHRLPSADASSTTTTSSSGKSNVPTLMMAEASAHLQVEFPARVSYSPPVQYLPLGLSGQIRCHVQAAPPVEFFTWTLNNTQFDPNIDPNVERLQNGSLLIKQVSKQYEGKYRCTPFNKHGSAGSSNAMEIRVEEAPQFDLKPADFYKANLNGQLKIPCDARMAGGPTKPNVSWRRVVVVSSESDSNTTTTLDRSQRDLLKKGRSISNKQFHQQQPLGVDEAADEPDEMHHFYAPTSTTSPANSVGSQDSNRNQRQQLQMDMEVMTTSATISEGAGDDDDDQSGLQEREQQPPVIVYAKLPSNSSEYKDSHLFLYNLRKEDHGRYECVIDNEVATLVASTMVYIEGKSLVYVFIEFNGSNSATY